VPRWSPDGSKIAFTNYADTFRPALNLGSSYGDSWPMEYVKVVDLATGKVSTVGHLGMATFYNAPVWASNGSLLLNVASRVVNP